MMILNPSNRSTGGDMNTRTRIEACAGAMFAGIAVSTLIATGIVHAQAYPTKAVRIIVPHPVGGPAFRGGKP